MAAWPRGGGWQTCECGIGGAWGIGALLGQVEMLGYSSGGWMVEAANLAWAVLALVGILLVLSRKTGVGLFTE